MSDKEIPAIDDHRSYTEVFKGMEADPVITSNSMFSYIALSLESWRSNSPIPELLMFLPREQLLSLLQLFGGSEIRLPTLAEYADHMVAAVAIFHIVCENKTLEWVCAKYGINGNKSRTIGKIVKTWTEYMSANNLDVLKFMNGAAKDVKNYAK